MATKEPIRNFVLYDRHGHEIDFSSFSVVSDVSVTFHAGVGEPYCESRYQGGILYLDFFNIKGEGITGITYDESQEDGGTNHLNITTDGVHEYTFPVKNGKRGNGITSIETVESQEDDGYNIVRIHCTDDESEDGTVLRIKNGKRGNGIASVTEEMSEQDGGTNTVTITDDDGQTHTIHTKNGRTGRPGADFQPIEDVSGLSIAHDLGTDEGKVMSQKGVTDAHSDLAKGMSSEVTEGYTTAPCSILSSTGNFGNSGNHAIFPVNVGDRYILENYDASQDLVRYAYATTDEYTAGSAVPVVQGTSVVVVNHGACAYITIPSGCTHLLWNIPANGNWRLYKYLDLSLSKVAKKVDNKPIIYGNQFIPTTDVNTLGDVLAAIPADYRCPLCVLVYRDKNLKLYVKVFNSQQPTNSSTWLDESNWKELIKDSDFESYIRGYLNDLHEYPYQFNCAEGNVITLPQSEYIVLSQDGDSFEADVSVGAETYTKNNETSGYGFARGIEGNFGIGICLSYKNIGVRADNKTWMLAVSGLTPYKYRYKFKIEYANGVVKFYLDGVLKSTYQGQETLTIRGFGNGGKKDNGTLSYGYWNGILHSLKVNGKDYSFRNATFTNFSTKEAKLQQMYAEKTADQLTVYQRLKGNYYVGYPLIHAVAEYVANTYPSFYDNWGLRQPKLYYYNGTSMTKLIDLFRDGEAETAVEAMDGNDSTNYKYVSGSTHGFEIIKTSTINDESVRHFAIMIDNDNIPEGGAFDLRPVSNVEVSQYSQLFQAYTNSSPFADVVKIWSWTDKFRIKTSINYTRDMKVYRQQQGMFCVYRRADGSTSNPYLTNRAVKGNTPYIIYNVEDDWESDAANDTLKAKDESCSQISEYGEMGIGFQLKIVDDNREQGHSGMFVSTNSGYYNKIYFCSHQGTSPEIADGTEYHATQEWNIYLSDNA